MAFSRLTMIKTANQGRTIAGGRVSYLALLLIAVLLPGCGDSKTPPLFEFERTLEIGGVSDLAWHPDGKRVAVTFYLRNIVEVWDVDENKRLIRLEKERVTPKGGNSQLIFSKDGQYLLALDADPRESRNEPNDLRRTRPASQSWTTSDWKPHRTYAFEAVNRFNIPRGMCLSPDGTSLLVASNYVLARFDLESGDLLKQIDLSHPFDDKRIEFKPFSMDCNPRHPQVAFGGYGPLDIEGQEWPSVEEQYRTPMIPLLIFDQDTLSLRHHFKAHTSFIKLRYSGDGKWLYSDTERGGHGVPVQDGKGIFTRVPKEPAYVWNTETWALHREIKQPLVTRHKPHWVNTVTLHAGAKPGDAIPGSPWILLTDFRPDKTRTLRLRNLETGEQVGALRVPEVGRVRITPDGRRMLIEDRYPLLYRFNAQDHLSKNQGQE